MNKLSLLFSVFFISLSFGQAKKNETTSISSPNYDAENVIGSAKSLQNEVIQDENIIYSKDEVEVKPEFPEGIQKFYIYICKNFKVPDVSGLNGKVYVTFVIEKEGELTDIKILRDIGYGTGKEAIRVLKLSPKWKPAELNGKKVRCLYSLPITISVPKEVIYIK